MSTASPQSLRRLLDAVVAIGTGLDLSVMLQRVTGLAAELAGARYGALGVLDEGGTGLAQFLTTGVDDETRELIGALPKGHGILGLLITEARPLRLSDIQQHEASFGFPPGHPPMRSFLGVPILVRGEVFGNLYLTEKVGGSEFSEADEELIVGLAAAAGVAIDNARLHARVSDLLVFEERERIARDLHDTVIQRIFATGLSLQGTVPLITTDIGTATVRIEAAVDDLDETVRQIRSAIFSLEAERPREARLTERVRSLCRESAGALGFDPVVTFGGPVDADVAVDVAADLLASVREGLSNVARHAGASTVEVDVRVADAAVALRIVDDGLGPPTVATGRGRGLANMTARALRHGGRCALISGSPRGAVLEWRAPRR